MLSFTMMFQLITPIAFATETERMVVGFEELDSIELYVGDDEDKLQLPKTMIATVTEITKESDEQVSSATPSNATQSNATQSNATESNATRRRATQSNATESNATQSDPTIITKVVKIPVE